VRKPMGRLVLAQPVDRRLLLKGVASFAVLAPSASLDEDRAEGTPALVIGR
jgi:hypothetical protein